jgi:2-keto-4-pentenoate hydratase
MARSRCAGCVPRRNWRSRSGLQPGDRILAGSACHVPVEPGDIVVAEIDGLGTVAATIAP